MPNALPFPALWFVLKESLRNLAKKNSAQRPVVVLSIRGLRQRYLYLLAQSFLRAGFFVLLDMDISRQCFWETDPYARYVFEDPGLRAVRVLPADRSRAILCHDHEDIDRAGWSKVVRIDYNIREAMSLPGAVVAPYWMHPNVYKTGLADSLATWRNGPKSVKMLFAGNISREIYGYKGPLNRDKLGRVEILDLIQAEFGERTITVRTREEFKDILGGAYRNSIVLFDGTKARLSREEWFPALSLCEYFLALPGVLMPMSHNLIEAMALGCIPICNYPEWLSPGLVHGDNCLAFSDRDSLMRSVEAALGAPDSVTSCMRTSVLDYFDTHLQPRAFVSPVLSSKSREVTVYVNAEEVSERASSNLSPQP